MKKTALSCLALCLPLIASSAHAEDIMSILARQAETPPRISPTTINYTYTLTLDIKDREGKDVSEVQAILRVDPTQPPGERAEVISSSDPDSESLEDFLKEVEDPENTMSKQADGFWCGSNADEADPDFGPEDFIVISEDETQAVIQPDMVKLAELLMQSDDNADKNGRKMMKKLLKRIEGEVTLSKPSGEMKGFSVRMTRPMTMMVVAKLKKMDVEQTCELAPNGHFHISTLTMNVEGKALGSRFGQELYMQISDLTPLP